MCYKTCFSFCFLLRALPRAEGQPRRNDASGASRRPDLGVRGSAPILFASEPPSDVGESCLPGEYIRLSDGRGDPGPLVKKVVGRLGAE